MANPNRITNVAIVGAGGNSGSYMTEALLKTGKHTLTALTRAGSQSKLPEGVITKSIDYAKPDTIVEALKGQDALVITLTSLAPKETQFTLVKAAAEAGVKWVLPNEWAPDTSNEGLIRDINIFQPAPAIRKAILDLGMSSYVAVSTGFWYEWSLSIPHSYGIDLNNRTATLFDEGETKISTSTWPQVGRTVAALLSLPIKPEGSSTGPSLEDFKNQMVYVQSFTVSQRDMLESAFRVTGTKEEDWKITKEPAKERYANGLKEMQNGDRIGFAKMLYTRVFYPDGSGDTEHNKVSSNAVLGLPKEDLDEATKRAVERAQTVKWS